MTELLQIWIWVPSHTHTYMGYVQDEGKMWSCSCPLLQDTEGEHHGALAARDGEILNKINPKANKYFSIN